MTAMQPLIITVSSTGRKSLIWNQTLRSQKWTAERKLSLELNSAFVPSPLRWSGPKSPAWKHMERAPCSCQRHEGWISTLSMSIPYFKSIPVFLSHSPASPCESLLIWLNYLFLCLHSQGRPLCIRMTLSQEFHKAAYQIYCFHLLCIVVLTFSQPQSIFLLSCRYPSQEIQSSHSIKLAL